MVDVNSGLRVGDKVRVADNLCAMSVVHSSMDMFCGKVLTVKEIGWGCVRSFETPFIFDEIDLVEIIPDDSDFPDVDNLEFQRFVNGEE